MLNILLQDVHELLSILGVIWKLGKNSRTCTNIKIVRMQKLTLYKSPDTVQEVMTHAYYVSQVLYGLGQDFLVISMVF